MTMWSSSRLISSSSAAARWDNVIASFTGFLLGRRITRRSLLPHAETGDSWPGGEPGSPWPEGKLRTRAAGEGDEPCRPPHPPTAKPFRWRHGSPGGRKPFSAGSSGASREMRICHVEGDNVSFVPGPLKAHALLLSAVLEVDHECLGLQPLEKLSGVLAPDDDPWHGTPAGDPGSGAALALPETGEADVRLFEWPRS